MKGLFNNKKIIISGVLLLLLLVVGVTYAIVAWTTTDYGVTLSTACFDVDYKLGKDITAVLNPTNTEEVLDNRMRSITINEDMAVSSISLAFKQECSRYSGLARIELNTTSIDNAFTENGDSYQSLQYLLIPYNSSEYPNVDIEHLSGETFSYVAGSTITETGVKEIFSTSLNPGEKKEFIIVFLIDSNLIDEDIIGASFTSRVDSSVEQKVSGKVTPISDFNYVIGTGNEITSIPIYTYSDCINELEEGQEPTYSSKEIYNYDISDNPITLDSNQILLTAYTGSDTDINIPDTYTINGVTYNVVLLSYLETNLGGKTITDSGISVEVPPGEGKIDYDFSRVSASPLNYSYTKFNTKLLVGETSGNVVGPGEIIVPVRPDMPDIPSYCVDYGLLLNNQTIESVTLGDNVKVIDGDGNEGNLANMFWNDTSLKNVSSIPSSATNMVRTFYGCTNLGGTIRVNSCSVNSFDGTFAFTNKSISLEVPAHSNTASNSGAVPSNVSVTSYANDVCIEDMPIIGPPHCENCGIEVIGGGGK